MADTFRGTVGRHKGLFTFLLFLLLTFLFAVATDYAPGLVGVVYFPLLGIFVLGALWFFADLIVDKISRQAEPQVAGARGQRPERADRGGKRTFRRVVAIVLFGPVILLVAYIVIIDDLIERARSRGAEFVRKNPEVARAAGGIKNVYPDSEYGTVTGPHRFMYSVEGDRRVSAVVELKLWRPGEVTLRCVTERPMSNSDFYEDRCKQ